MKQKDSVLTLLDKRNLLKDEMREVDKQLGVCSPIPRERSYFNNLNFSAVDSTPIEFACHRPQPVSHCISNAINCRLYFLPNMISEFTSVHAYCLGLFRTGAHFRRHAEIFEGEHFAEVIPGEVVHLSAALTHLFLAFLSIRMTR